jgi:hypothetical protein
MSTPTREQVYSALFALVSPLLAPGAVGGPPDGGADENGVPASPGTPSAGQPFNLVSREVIEPQRVPVGLQPCLMQYEFNEENVFSGRAMVKKVWTVVFIIAATHARGTPGATVLNPLIDLVESLFVPPVGEDVLTLGLAGIDNVQLTGTGGKDHGDNSTKTETRQAVYYLPVEITLPAS